MAIVAAAGMLPPARHKGPSAMTRREPDGADAPKNTQLIEMKNDILHFMSSAAPESHAERNGEGFSPRRFCCMTANEITRQRLKQGFLCE